MKFFSKKTGALLTAAAITITAATELNCQPASAAGTIDISTLCSSLGSAHNYGVFTRYFRNGSDMEGNMCVENAYIVGNDATNSENNYSIYDNNSITVNFTGAEGQSVTFALFEKSGNSYIPVPGTEKTITIPSGMSSATHIYYNSDELPLYQTNTYYLAKTNGNYEIIDIAEVNIININNNVSNNCYIANLKTVGGNFTRENFSDLVIYLAPETVNKITSYNNGNGLTLYADDNTSVSYNTMLDVRKIGENIATINFDSEFTNLTNLSKSLIDASSSSTVKIINITAEELDNNVKNNKLFNVEVADGQYAVLNIDADSDVYTDANPLRLAYTVNNVLAQWNLLASRVLVNIYDSTNGNVFTGKATCYQNGGTMGTILVPGGTYESGPGNTNGGVIAETVELTAGEIHKIQFGFNEKANTIINIISDIAPVYEFSFVKTDSSTSSPLSGAAFTLYSDAKCKNPLQKSTSGSEGSVTFTSLSNGVYYIKETTVPDGYVANNTIYTLNVANSGITLINNSTSTEVATDANGTYIISNTPAVAPYADLLIHKLSSTSPLSGAGFTLYSDYECKNALGNEKFSDSDGKISFSNLNSGTYYLKETTIPSGYNNTNKIYKVVVVADSLSSSVTVDGSDATNGYDIQNSLIPTYNFTFKKTKSDGITPVAGAEFTLYSDSACKNVITSSSSVSDGTVSFTVNPGIYHIRETGIPSGYLDNNTIYSANVSENGVIIMEADITGTLDGTVNDYIIKNLTPEDIVVTPAEKIQLKKQYDSTDLSTQEILAATVFTLYGSYDGTTLSDPKSSASPVWDSTQNMAIVSFENVYSPSTGFVIYYLKETASPVEYSTSDVIYECKIDSDSNVTYRIYSSTDDYSETFPICNNLKVADPTNPDNNTPSDPGNDDPSDPGNDTPSDPGNDTPSDPGNDTPSDPGNDTPSDPGNDTPSDPGNNTPSTPDDDKPSTPDDDSSDSDNNDDESEEDSEIEEDEEEDSEIEEVEEDDSENEEVEEDDSENDIDEIEIDENIFTGDVSGNIIEENPYTAVIISASALASFLASVFAVLVTKKRK